MIVILNIDNKVCDTRAKTAKQRRLIEQDVQRRFLERNQKRSGSGGCERTNAEFFLLHLYSVSRLLGEKFEFCAGQSIVYKDVVIDATN